MDHRSANQFSIFILFFSLIFQQKHKKGNERERDGEVLALFSYTVLYETLLGDALLRRTCTIIFGWS
jgi:hypothetical protein